MMLDYNIEYDFTKVDTPENRRGMVKLLEKNAKIVESGEKPVFADPEGRDDPSVSLYLRILADYSDMNSDKPESLEAALELCEQYPGSDDCFSSLCDHLRYIKLLYVSPDAKKGAWPATCRITVDERDVRALPVFTRRKLIQNDTGSKMHSHHTTIYDFLKVCEAEGINNIVINPHNTTEAFDAGDIRKFIDNCRMIDTFWDCVRYSGVEGADLFPLLAQDFLYRTVSCIYGNGRTVQGYCIPYTKGRAPGYFIEKADRKMTFVPLSELKFIRAVPDEDDPYRGQDR
ncbi:MAG: SseB family protein [Clostridia bacterium]|nr:SseB family protein [Clostridia bacterium]